MIRAPASLADPRIVDQGVGGGIGERGGRQAFQLRSVSRNDAGGKPRIVFAGRPVESLGAVCAAPGNKPMVPIARVSPNA
mgnify:CR=1 FL=1